MQTFTFTDALIIAAECHRNITDGGGVDYIKHPLHLANELKIRGYSNECQMAALLHDVLEDGDPAIFNEAYLISRGVPESVMAALRLLNHVRDEAFVTAHTDMLVSTHAMNPRFAKVRAKEEEYMRYIRRLAKNDIARAVKIADLEHNSQISRIKESDLEDFKTREYIGRRNMKYAAARNYLTGGRVGY